MTAQLGLDPLSAAMTTAIAMLSASLVFAAARLFRGPSTPDRVVALDLAALLVLGFIAVHAIMTNDDSLLSGGLVIGLLAFLGAVAFARYIERLLEP